MSYCDFAVYHQLDLCRVLQPEVKIQNIQGKSIQEYMLCVQCCTLYDPHTVQCTVWELKWGFVSLFLIYCHVSVNFNCLFVSCIGADVWLLNELS